MTDLITRRQLLAAVAASLYAERLAAQASRVRPRLVLRPGAPEEPPPEPSESRPHTLISGQEGVDAIRTQLQTDSVYRARYQQAVTQFEEAGGHWASGPTTAEGKYGLMMGAAAFFTCIRRPDNNYGINHNPTYTWQYYRDRLVTQALDYVDINDNYERWAQGVALTYDLLYNDLSASERQAMGPWVALKAGVLPYCEGRWDDQSASEHVGKVICGLAADDAADRAQDLYINTLDWAISRVWTAYNSTGYEWKQGYPSNTGQIFCLWMLKNFMGLTEAVSTDQYLYHLQHAWQCLAELPIPHPGRALPFTAKLNMSSTLTPINYADPCVGAHLLWGWAMLPGKTNLNGLVDVRGEHPHAIANQATLANSEAALFGYGRHLWDTLTGPSAVNNFKWIGDGSPSTTKGMLHVLTALVPWLVLNVQLPTAVTPAAAGIPLVRHWWPGTLGLTTIRSDHTIANSLASLIMYWHKRWYVNGYEGVTRFNGSWQAHRAGPLFGQRASKGHSAVDRKLTPAANGCVTFIDEDLYDIFQHENLDTYDVGGQKEGQSSDFKSEVLAQALSNDSGQVLGWYSDTQICAGQSDLTRSYNSPTYTMPAQPGNAPKTSSFIREFVTIQRGGDGTDHERIFTYDRITVLERAPGLYFQPRYHLNPASSPTIDGTETADPVWGPQGAPVSGGLIPTWYAIGPTKWDYAGASYVQVDNLTEPAAKVGSGTFIHTVVGNGKARATVLIGGNAAAPTDFTLVKTGGTNARRFENGSPTDFADECPIFGDYREWYGPNVASEWKDQKGLSTRAYVGMYNVYARPNTIVADTRFLVTTDMMDATTGTPAAAALLTSDADSVAAQSGPSVVVFAKSNSGHSSGSVTLPAGTTLVVFKNLPPSVLRTLTPGTGVTISSANRTPSNTGTAHGVLVVDIVTAAGGTLAWS